MPLEYGDDDSRVMISLLPSLLDAVDALPFPTKKADGGCSLLLNNVTNCCDLNIMVTTFALTCCYIYG